MSPVREDWLEGKASLALLTSDRPLFLCSYDLAHNQVVICSNRALTEEKVRTVLAHELVHMYDHCANNMDWTDSQHLACSEVTTTNLSLLQSPPSLPGAGSEYRSLCWAATQRSA